MKTKLNYLCMLALAVIFTTACSNDDDNPTLDGPSGTVIGQVTAANGTTPIPGASVKLMWYNMDDPNLPMTTTDSEGNYTLENVPQGSQTILASRGIFEAQVAVSVVADQVVEAPVAQLQAAGDIAYINGSYDSIEDIVQGILGHEIDEVTPEIFYDLSQLQNYRMIFVNCGSGAYYTLFDESDGAAQNIQQWIENGGILYASDLELPFLRELFPNHILEIDGGSTGTTTADVVSQPLSDFIGRTEVEVVYNLGGWNAPGQTSETVTSLINGPYPNNSGEGDLAISFQYGQGEVVYTSFHNSASATEDQQAVLTYYVYGFGEGTRSSAVPHTPQSITPQMHEAHQHYADNLEKFK